ncbi:MAG: SpoVR family protein [Bacteroidales bacterium]|nr:SpoVR family protein [Bacteroidales bacterium]
MILIDQHSKAIMEECKRQARIAGLSFSQETLEYIVTNKDMIELSPKVMIPTLYDYWVNDVEVLKGKGKYLVYPSNPYETVINTRPAISFYNDNNPDWLNVMIYYHVLGHIDFFQNNALFENTWNDDFVGQALSDKRLIENLRIKYGRWTDYVVEFARAIDNLSGYFQQLSVNNYPEEKELSSKLDYYFQFFLQEELKVPEHIIFNEISRYNNLFEKDPHVAEALFFTSIKEKHANFLSLYEKYLSKKQSKPQAKKDVIEFILDHSLFLKQENNQWMKSIISIVRSTSLYFNPQIRTKIINEGWASYWHDKLFRSDDRMKTHEVAFAKINAGVTSISRVGLNPYAIGLRLIEYVEDLANKGKMTWGYQKLLNIAQKEDFNIGLNKGQESIFALRKYFSDFTLINTFVDQDFVDRHDLFVTGKRYNPQRQTIEYYVKSRKAVDYKKMLLDSLYHPPVTEVNESKTNEKELYLNHLFEGKQLVKEFIPDVMVALEFLWGGEVKLETTEIIAPQKQGGELTYKSVIYSIKDRKVSKSDKA